jgi:hypothetical protein
VRQAVATLLGTFLVALAALGALLIWHLVRRGRLIREGLNRPRPVHWPEIEPTTAQNRDNQRDARTRRPES